jgi:hypothetical protein
MFESEKIGKNAATRYVPEPWVHRAVASLNPAWLILIDVVQPPTVLAAVAGVAVTAAAVRSRIEILESDPNFFHREIVRTMSPARRRT